MEMTDFLRFFDEAPPSQTILFFVVIGALLGGTALWHFIRFWRR
jgi:hypothetical protein